MSNLIWRNSSSGLIIRNSSGNIVRCSNCPCDDPSGPVPSSCPSGLPSTYTVQDLLGGIYYYNSGTGCTGAYRSASDTTEMRQVDSSNILTQVSDCRWQIFDVDTEIRTYDTNNQEWGSWTYANGAIILELINDTEWQLLIAVLSYDGFGNPILSNGRSVRRVTGNTPVGIYSGRPCQSNAFFDVKVDGTGEIL